MKNCFRSSFVTLSLLAALLTLSFAAQPISEGAAYVNGRWFDGAGFRQATWYVVNGALTTRRPSKVSETVDLRGGFVIPPLGDAHQHIFNSRETFAAETKRFLQAGVYYVVQKQIKAGKKLDAIKAQGLPARWRSWAERGISADFFLTNVFEGLTTHAKR